MNNDDLVLRRQKLLMRSAQLRMTLADQTQVFKSPLAVTDQAIDGVHWLYRNPQWPLGAMLVLIVIRPRRAILWAGRAWWAWTAFKRTQNWIATRPLQRFSP